MNNLKGNINDWIIIGLMAAVLIFLLILRPIFSAIHKKHKKKKWQKEHPEEEYPVKKKNFFLGFLKFVIFVGVLGGTLFGLPYLQQRFKTESISKKMEEKPPYGETITVNDEKINIVKDGTGSDILFLYPREKLASPYLYYKPLTSILNKKFTTIIVEPFGYGLSSTTKKERSLDNMLSEMHSVVESLGYTSYSILADGFGGLPMLKYVDTYKNEIKSYIGIDSMPGILNVKTSNFFLTELDASGLFTRFYNNSGYRRLASQIKDEWILPKTDYLYTKEEKELYRDMALTFNDTETQLAELKAAKDWSTETQELYVPKEVPNYQIISTGYASDIQNLAELGGKNEMSVSIGGHNETIKAADFWEKLHYNPLNEKNEVVKVSGKTLPLSQYKDCGEKIIAWFETL